MPEPKAPAWNFMQLEIVPADRLVMPMIGPGGLTRDAALAEIQSILDRMARLSPAFADVATIWRRGAKDDAAFYGPFVWTVYDYPDGEDPRRAALTWIEDYARILRSRGLNVSVPRLP